MFFGPSLLFLSSVDIAAVVFTVPVIVHKYPLKQLLSEFIALTRHGVCVRSFWGWKVSNRGWWSGSRDIFRPCLFHLIPIIMRRVKQLVVKQFCYPRHAMSCHAMHRYLLKVQCTGKPSSQQSWHARTPVEPWAG